MIRRLAYRVLAGSLLLVAGAGSPPVPAQNAPAVMPPAADAARGDSLLSLPDSVKGEAGSFILVKATSNCRVVKWYVIDTGLSLLPPDLLKDSKTAIVLASTAGKYRVLAYTATPDGTPSEPSVCLVVVAGPGPTPVPPGPVPPGPTPPPIPVPAMGLRVIFVYESSANMTREQLNTLNSTAINKYLDAKTVKNPHGRPEWRKWDKDINIDNESGIWKDLWAATKPQLTQLPAIVIVNEEKGQVFPLPETEAKTLELLRRFGGN